MRENKSEVVDFFGTELDKVKKYGWKIADKAGDFCWMDKGDLYVDHVYQRSRISEERINFFASNWSWVKCGVLSIAIRDDEWYIFDGQHRKLAADKRSDIKKLPCIVYELESVAEEARAFIDINTTKTVVTGVDRFRAMIVAGDETALGLNQLVEARGYQVSHSQAIKSISCIMTIWAIYKQDRELFTSVWPLITDICEDCVIRHAVVESVYWAQRAALRSGITLDRNPIRAFLIKTAGEQLVAEIRKEINIIGHGGLRIEANALIKLLNKQKFMKKKKIPLAD